MKRVHTVARAWYGGRTPPPEDVLIVAETADSEPHVLYDHLAGQGEYASVVRGIYDRMDSLKRNPQEFRSWALDDGMSAFLQVLLDLGPAELRSRLQTLTRLGSLQFRKSEGPDERKARVHAVFAPPEGDEDYRVQILGQARRLAALWSPRPDSVLDYVISRPAQVGRLVAEGLSPSAAEQLRVVGHAFTDVRRATLLPFAGLKTVAWERQRDIHLLTAVRPVLEKWDPDAAGGGACAQVTLLDALLLHEIVEVLLDAREPALEPLDCHLVASTFERYLKGEMLSVAAEDFFLEWPPLSAQEMEEQREAEMVEQLREVTQYMDEQQAPDQEDDDLERLPMDTASAAATRRVKVKKVLARSKDGKTRIVKRPVEPDEE